MNVKHLITITESLSLSVLLSACGSNANSEAKSVEVPAPKVVAAAPTFQKIDSVIGTGDTASAGQTVSVHYTGWLFDAKKDTPHLFAYFECLIIKLCY